MTIDIEMILQAAAVCGALGTIVALIYKGVQWLERQKAQDKEIENIKKEQCIICYGVLACLKGLEGVMETLEGMEGFERVEGKDTVTEARCKMEKYINQTAHE